MVDKHKAIEELYSNVASIEEYSNGTFVVKNKEGNTIEIDMSLVNAWSDPNQYKIDRAAEYPTIKDQLDDIYHNGIDGWKATIKKVKDKYPKE